MARNNREKKERWQTHVYLNEDDFKRLKAIADAESRSMTGQIEYFLRRGIDSYVPSAELEMKVVQLRERLEEEIGS